ncbi:MAG: hypothetical protein ABEI75_00725 [Halobaculum sp.]
MISRPTDGDGSRLYIDAETSRRLQLAEGTEVTLRTLEVDGDVVVCLEGLPTGFDTAAFVDFADEHNWVEQTEPTESARLWRTGADVLVTLRDRTSAAGELINNVLVEGPWLPVDPSSVSQYGELTATVADEPALSLEIDDDGGRWTELRHSRRSEVSGPPDEETMCQLLAAGGVTVRVTASFASAVTTLKEVGDAVRTIAAVSDRYATDRDFDDPSDCDTASDDVVTDPQSDSRATESTSDVDRSEVEPTVPQE